MMTEMGCYIYASMTSSTPEDCAYPRRPRVPRAVCRPTTIGYLSSPCTCLAPVDHAVALKRGVLVAHDAVAGAVGDQQAAGDIREQMATKGWGAKRSQHAAPGLVLAYGVLTPGVRH
jgi:hypothetical protein